MKISEVCKRTGISRRNIHFYIQEGLITPVSDSENHYYDFTEEDCQTLLFIREMRNTGLPIPTIKSMLFYPVTAGYYLNQHVKKLKREHRHLEQTLISLQYILDDLPFYPDLKTLRDVTALAGIPDPISQGTPAEFDHYSTAIINRMLWGGFLPEKELTEYQEFLWLKINRLTAESPSDDYLRLRNALFTMNSSQINRLFNTNRDRYKYIAGLTEDSLPLCVEDTISQLRTIIDTPLYIRFWSDNYDNFFAPTTRIQASSISLLAMELSPVYNNYVGNIVRVCDEVYSYLLSEAGTALHQTIQSVFGEKLNLEAANHGELEALISVPLLCAFWNK